MDPTSICAIVAILGAILLFANLIALFGYPLLIVTAVLVVRPVHQGVASSRTLHARRR